ncbi:MFS transporter [Penicillium hispanicum]|uniref:MFS transporter n=1 Tax=Penicillium hispanicum TaxID=1080232 RepID=UPI0025407879|nr:MFS transporter [Penicillium hispanicum]KAJ5578463.1 MFS transporter [Penicillium hispanicum]
MLGIDRLEGSALRATILVTCGFCFTLFGYDQGVLGGVISVPLFLKAINNPDSTIQGVVVSIFDVGCMVGCGLSAVYGLTLGRRNALMAGGALIVLGGAGQAAVFHIAQMVIFRIIAGVGLGVVSSTVPVWLSETSKPGKRGRNVAIQLILVLFGNVTSYWINYALSYTTGQITIRFPLAWQCFYPIVALLLATQLPESPRVLYLWNKAEEADEVLRQLRGASSIHDPELANEKKEILDGIAFDQERTSGDPLWRILFWDKSPIRNSRRLFIIVMIQGLQQLGGANVIAYYQTELFSQSVKLAPNISKLVAGCSAICYMMGTFPAAYLVEKLGRRRLMLAGSFGCFTTMLIFMILLALGEGNVSMGWGAVAMLFLFEFIYATSWCSVVWVYCPEISPLRFRHINTSLGVMSQWAMTFLTVMMAPTAIQNTGWRIYIFFVIANFLQMPFVFFFCPETSGKKLEDIDAFFEAALVVDNIDVEQPEPSKGTMDEKAREI